MPRPTLLSPDALLASLQHQALWNLQGNTIEREFTAANFAAAVGFINAVAVMAETADHHPDILLYGWNKVKIILSTHDQGGLTELDFMLAAKIDSVAFPVQ